MTSRLPQVIPHGSGTRGLFGLGRIPRPAEYVHRAPKIGLITPSGWGNLGDAAIQDAVILNIRRRCPDAIIRIFSLNPVDTTQRHHVPSETISGFSITPGYHVDTRVPVVEWPIEPATSGASEPRAAAQSAGVPELHRTNGSESRPHILSVASAKGVAKTLLRRTGPLHDRMYDAVCEFRHARHARECLAEFDLLLVSGGGQIDDEWGGPWGHPYALFKWSRVALATRTPMAVVGVGVCQLRSRLSRFFMRRALAAAASRSFRDAESSSLAIDWNLSHDHFVVPDLAFGLPVRTARAPLPGERLIVGVSPIAFCDPRMWSRRDSSVYDAVVQRFAEFVVWLSRTGHDIVMFTSDISDQRTVADVLAAVERACPETAGRILNTPTETVDQLLEVLPRLHFAVTSRLHGTLLACAHGIPTMALSYDRKIGSLMTDLGQQDYCLDIETVELDDMTETFGRLKRSADEVRRSTAVRVAGYRRSLDEQFDWLTANFMPAPAPPDHEIVESLDG